MSIRSRVSNLSLIKTAPTQNKAGGFLGSVFSISGSFHASLNYKSYVNCLTNKYRKFFMNDDSNLEQLPRQPFERIFRSNKFASATISSKNTLPNKCKKYSCSWESSILVLEQYLKFDLRSESVNPRFYLPLF